MYQHKNHLRVAVTALILALAALVSLAGCGSAGGQGSQVTIEGAVEDNLKTVLGNANSALGADNGLAVSMDIQLTANNCQDMAGLTPDQFNQNVEEAWASQAMIMTIPHSVALLKCNSAAAAQTVKSAIAAGFDPLRWICVIPEQCFVVEAGNYVLFAATRNDVAAALQAAFTDLAGGQIGSVNKFFDAAKDDSGLPVTVD